jgi:energy-coupling factor transporter ATP-binding protein EcfA2
MKSNKYKGENVKIVLFEQEDNTWYEPEKVESLLKKYIDSNSTRIKEAVYSKEQLEAIINEIGNDDNQVNSFIIPLNVNVSTGNFEGQNHWVGLYITKEQDSAYKIKYYNPTGDKINNEIEQQLYHLLNFPIESIGIVLQLGTEVLHAPEIHEFQGNINDCGPFLVYGLTCISQGKEICGVNDFEGSKQLGQKLRKSLINQDSFDKIYANINNIPTTTSPSKISKSDALVHKTTLKIDTASKSITETDADGTDTKIETEVVEQGKQDIASVKEVKALLDIQKTLHTTEFTEQEEQSILVIGKTGAGKSTLVNYLTNPERMKVELIVDPKNKYDVGTLEIKVIDCPTSPIIGCGVNSTTTIPNKWYEYWDCPGFDDNTSAEQDITNAFFIKKVFDMSKNIKPLLVIGWGDLTGNANPVKQLTDTLGNLFNSVEDIIPGISLVVTKVPQNQGVKNIKHHISRLLKAECFNQDSSGKEILQLCLRAENNIALFPEVTQEGSLISLIGGNEKILEVINTAEFVTSPKVNIAISDRSQNRVAEIVAVLNERIDGLIADLTCKYFDKYKLAIKDCSNKEALVKDISLIKEAIDRVKDFLNATTFSSEGNIGECGKAKIIAEALKKYFPESEYELIRKDISQCIELFEFCIDIKKQTEEFFKTSNFLQHFNNSQTKLSGILDNAEGQLVRIIVDEADNALKEFVKSIKEDLITNLPTAIENNNKEAIAFYRNYTEKVQKSFNKSITLDTLPFIIESLSAYSPYINLNTLAQHKELLNVLQAEWGRKYNESLSEFVKPLKQFKEEYNAIVEDVQRDIHNKFVGHFDMFSREMSHNNNTLEALKALSEKLNACLSELQEIHNVRPLIEIALKIWPFDNNLMAAESALSKIEILQQIGVAISSIDQNKVAVCITYLETSKLNVDSIYTNLYERKIGHYVNNIIREIKKSTYDKIEGDQKDNLVGLLNLNLEGDFFSQVSDLGREIISTYGDSILISRDLRKIDSLKTLNILQGDKLEKLNQILIDKLHNKLKDLSTYISCSIAGDKAVQDFVENMVNYIGHVDGQHNKIIDIKSNLQNLATLFLKAKGISMIQSVQMIQSSLNELGSYNEALSHLNEIGIDANLNPTNYNQGLDKLCAVISDQITWYNTIEGVHEIILTKGYLFAPDYPAVDSINFTQFLSILKHNGLTLTSNIEYDDHKAKQLNDLLQHSWQSPPSRSANSQELVFKGECIKVSDIMQDIGRNITSVKVVCYNSVVFDSNIIAKGINLTVISPLWYIPAPINVDLSGKDAISYFSRAKDGSGYIIGTGIGSKGVEGLPGNPGGNSGNFCGIGYKFVNLGYISNVNLMGGKGGKGQDGGHGSHGQYGADATMQDFWDGYSIRLPNEGNWYQFGKMYNRIELCKGHSGYQGGNGGKGGKGGLGGQNGTLKIFDTHQQNQLEIRMPTSSVNGEPGTAGKGGCGGKYGNDLKVYYFQNQYTTVRDYEVLHINKYAVNGYMPHQLSFKTPVANIKNDCTLDTSQELGLLGDSFCTTTHEENDFYYKIHTQVVQEFCNSQHFSGKGLRGFDEREAAIGSYASQFNEYYNTSVDKILNLRIGNLPEDQAINIKFFGARLVSEQNNDSLNLLVSDLLRTFMENNTVLVPCNLYGKHWVGLVFEKADKEVIVRYMDSENNVIPAIVEKELITQLNNFGYKTKLIQEYVELQKANNCAVEMIENFMLYLVGSRLSQDKAVPFHSQLLEEYLVNSVELVGQENGIFVSGLEVI